MNTTDLAAPNYRDMINTTRIRSSLRRLFTGSMDEIVGELLQNSQRARARRVVITTTEDGFTFSDDGTGLQSGLAGFWTLLRIAESSFDNPTIADQDPMGLGVHALLAHDKVVEVTFTSGSLALTVDTRRWWEDEGYYRSWSDRVVAVPAPVSGFHIQVRCDPKLVAELRKTTEPEQRADLTYRRRWSPFQGYHQLTITCDGLPVVTDLPGGVLPQTIVARTQYQGQDLIIGVPLGRDDHQQHYTTSAVMNWYGQLVPLRAMRGWSYYLAVTDGRPVNPKSPSRQGVIEDSALERLEGFVQDTIFETLRDPASRDVITPTVISAAYALNRDRAKNELPYLVVEEYANPVLSEDAFEDLGQYHAPVVVRYADRPLLLNEGLYVDIRPTSIGPVLADDAWEAHEYGIDSFIPLIRAAGQTPFRLVCGDEQRLTMHRLYWQPGAMREDEFNLPGCWGLSSTGTPPETWQGIPEDRIVFAFTDPSSYDAMDVNWTVGTSDPLTFLGGSVWFGFLPDEEEDTDPQRDMYRESISQWRRQIIGASVPHHFTYRDLQNHMPTKGAAILHVTYVLPRKTRGAPAKKDTRAPIAVIVRNTLGEEMKLKLID